MPTETKIHDILVPGAKEKFVEWIATRGGIAVWPCVNLSNLKGPTFTPALDKPHLSMAEGLHEPTPTRKPSWEVASHPEEIITDLSRFRFATKLEEKERFRVRLRMGGNGMSMKLEDSSVRNLKRRIAKYGPDAVYRFDYGTQEAVIEVPVFE